MAKTKNDANPVAAETAENTAGQFHTCECCTPANNLVLKPEYGTAAGGQANIALCVMHQPSISVHVWVENEGRYRLKKDYRFQDGQVLDKQGQPLSVQEDAPASLLDDTTVVDEDTSRGSHSKRGQGRRSDEGGPGPDAENVDLGQDRWA